MPINEPADGLQEEPDPGVHRALRRARRAAHRPAHRRHRRRRAGAARPRRALHDRARHLLRRGQGRASPSSTCRGTSCSGSTSSPTRTTTGTCCRSSPRRSPTARPCSSRSSSATAPRASARATSRRCSRRSSATRPPAAICEAMKPPVAGAAGSPSCRAISRGGRPTAAMAEHGLASAIKLASNESPFGPLPGVADAVAAAAARRQPLPRPHRRGARASASPPTSASSRDRVAAGPGSVGLLEQLALAYVDHGDEVVYPWPSFIAYPQFTRLAGGVESTVPLRRQAFDADGDRRRDLRAHPRRADRQPEQPDVDGAAHRRPARASSTPRRPTASSSSTRPTASSSPAPTSPTPSSCSATAPTSPCCARCRRRTGWPACASGSSSPTRPSSTPSTPAPIPFGVNAAAQAAALAALDQHAEVARRCAVVDRRADPRRPGAAPAGPRRAGERGQLLVAAGRRRLGARSVSPSSGAASSPGRSASACASRSASPEDNDRFLDALDDAVAAEPALTADWGTATGANAVAAADWLDRLDAADRPLPRPPRRSTIPGAPIRSPARTRRGTTARCGRTSPSSATTGSPS